MKNLTPLLLTLCLCFSISNASAQFEQADQELLGSWETSWHTSFHGIREIKTYVPSQVAEGVAPRALVLALHGCLQNTYTFNAGASLAQYAEKNNVILVMPEQPEMVNVYRCWSWFLSSTQNGQGETAFLVDLVRSFEKKYNSPRGKNYVFGMSAGGAMSLVLANCYPQDFKAAASHHGIPYRAMMNAWQSQEVFFKGPKVEPEKSAQLGFQCMGEQRLDKLMPALIIQGTKGTMSLKLAPTAEKQMVAFNDLIHNGALDNSLQLKQKTKRVTDQSLYPFTQTVWLTSNNKPLVKRLEIEGLGHSWSGGDNTYDFNDPHGPRATEIIFDFFKVWDL